MIFKPILLRRNEPNLNLVIAKWINSFFWLWQLSWNSSLMKSFPLSSPWRNSYKEIDSFHLALDVCSVNFYISAPHPWLYSWWREMRLCRVQFIFLVSDGYFRREEFNSVSNGLSVSFWEVQDEQRWWCHTHLVRGNPPVVTPEMIGASMFFTSMTVCRRCWGSWIGILVIPSSAFTPLRAASEFSYVRIFLTIENLELYIQGV